MKIVEQGWERDRLAGGGLSIRWWFVVFLNGEDGRPQRPRLGVDDYGFRFARGGRVETNQEAQDALEEARREVEREYEYWRGQPSHTLSPAGALVPLIERLEVPA